MPKIFLKNTKKTQMEKSSLMMTFVD